MGTSATIRFLDSDTLKHVDVVLNQDGYPDSVYRNLIEFFNKVANEVEDPGIELDGPQDFADSFVKYMRQIGYRSADTAVQSDWTMNQYTVDLWTGELVRGLVLERLFVFDANDGRQIELDTWYGRTHIT